MEEFASLKPLAQTTLNSGKMVGLSRSNSRMFLITLFSQLVLLPLMMSITNAIFTFSILMKESILNQAMLSLVPCSFSSTLNYLLMTLLPIPLRFKCILMIPTLFIARILVQQSTALLMMIHSQSYTIKDNRFMSTTMRLTIRQLLVEILDFKVHPNSKSVSWANTFKLGKKTAITRKMGFSGQNAILNQFWLLTTLITVCISTIKLNSLLRQTMQVIIIQDTFTNPVFVLALTTLITSVLLIMKNFTPRTPSIGTIGTTIVLLVLVALA